MPTQAAQHQRITKWDPLFKAIARWNELHEQWKNTGENYPPNEYWDAAYFIVDKAMEVDPPAHLCEPIAHLMEGLIKGHSAGTVGYGIRPNKYIHKSYEKVVYAKAEPPATMETLSQILNDRSQTPIQNQQIFQMFKGIPAYEISQAIQTVLAGGEWSPPDDWVCPSEVERQARMRESQRLFLNWRVSWKEFQAALAMEEKDGWTPPAESIEELILSGVPAAQIAKMHRVPEEEILRLSHGMDHGDSAYVAEPVAPPQPGEEEDPDNHAEIVQLYLTDPEQSNKEIAEKLGIHHNTVSAAIRRWKSGQ